MSYDEPEFPITDWYGQQPLPDVSRIERGRWRDVLAPLTRRARVIACGSAREHFHDALSIAGELLISDPRPAAPRLPAPSLPGAGSLTGKQANVRCATAITPSLSPPPTRSG
jgi:hypothetical protein